MRVLSLFSGAGGMDLGLERAGHQVVGMCEVNEQAAQVLRHHWPDVPVHDDVTTLDGGVFDGRVDIVVGGSPCQDLSTVGDRAGLGGERSGLFWQQCRVADESNAGWVLWENVAGALSSNNGADFAAVLWGLTGVRPAVPEDGWRTVGMCVGPERTAVWRLFDARWFGVPQRRRRVFVVAGPRHDCRLDVLVDAEGRDWDSAPCHGESAGVAAGVPVGVGGHRGSGGVNLIAAFDSTWSGRYPISTEDVSPTVKVGSTLGVPSPPAVAYEVAGETVVRRLTPNETEMLMGWPTDWTRWGAGGVEMSFADRYRMCGNGVVAPIAEWVGRRIPQIASQTGQVAA